VIHQKHHNRDNNSHYDQEINNKRTQLVGRKNGDDIGPYVDLHMETECANYRKVEKGTQKTQ